MFCKYIILFFFFFPANCSCANILFTNFHCCLDFIWTYYLPPFPAHCIYSDSHTYKSDCSYFAPPWENKQAHSFPESDSRMCKIYPSCKFQIMLISRWSRKSNTPVPGSFYNIAYLTTLLCVTPEYHIQNYCKRCQLSKTPSKQTTTCTKKKKNKQTKIKIKQINSEGINCLPHCQTCSCNIIAHHITWQQWVKVSMNLSRISHSPESYKLFSINVPNIKGQHVCGVSSQSIV